MATGSLGMLPSASLGAADDKGMRRAMYEPVHGSAPDIAGKGVANPIATIASFAMCLRYSFDLGDAADAIEKAIADVLDQGLRTADIKQDGCKTVGTREMGECHHRVAKPCNLDSHDNAIRPARGFSALDRRSSAALAAEDAAKPDLGPQVTSKRVLTPEEKAEKEARKACKIEICDIVATKEPRGPDVACDIIKTWRAEDIVKMLGGRINWPWGKAVCQSKLRLERAPLAERHERTPL